MGAGTRAGLAPLRQLHDAAELARPLRHHHQRRHGRLRHTETPGPAETGGAQGRGESVPSGRPRLTCSAARTTAATSCKRHAALSGGAAPGSCPPAAAPHPLEAGRGQVAVAVQGPRHAEPAARAARAQGFRFRAGIFPASRAGNGGGATAGAGAGRGSAGLAGALLLEGRAGRRAGAVRAHRAGSGARTARPGRCRGGRALGERGAGAPCAGLRGSPGRAVRREGWMDPCMHGWMDGWTLSLSLAELRDSGAGECHH